MRGGGEGVVVFKFQTRATAKLMAILAEKNRMVGLLYL